MRCSVQNLCLLVLTASCGFSSAAYARSAKASDSDVAKRIEHSNRLPFRAEHFIFHAPSPNWEMGPVSGVAFGGNGMIYVIQRGSMADPILAFDGKGNLIRSWGKGDFTLPHSLRLDPQGNVWAVDAGQSLVIKYSPRGHKLLTISVGQKKDTGGPFQGATDVAFAPNGHVFVTDGYGNARVLEFASNGRRIGEWGRSGSGPAEFRLPHAIQVSQSGTIFVADRENGRIEKFGMQGKFLGEIDGLGRCYSIRLMGGALWASVSPMGEDPGAPGSLVKLDPKSGRILGHLDVPEQREGHAIDISGSGEPVVTTGSDLLWFRHR